MTPNSNSSSLSTHVPAFGTAVVNGNDNNPAVNHGHAPPVPTLRNVAHHAQDQLAQDGMDIASESDDEGEHDDSDDHGGAGGMKRRQPETGFDPEGTTEPKLRRRMSVSAPHGASPVDPEAERDAALLFMAENGGRDDEERTALMLAAKEGRAEVVRHLLDLPSADTQLAVTDDAGYNALMYAANSGHDEIVRQLLALSPALAVATENEGWNALMLAARYGHDGVVAQLLALPSADTQLAARDDGGWNALMHAAGNGHDGVVRQLLALSPALAVATDEYGKNALVYAAEAGHEEVVRQLLGLPSTAVQLQAVTHDGNTAVDLAYHYQGDRRVLSRLLAAGGRAAQDHDRVLAYGIDLAYQGQPAFLWMLPPAEVRPFISWLAQAGVDLHAVDEGGWNALMTACFAGRSDVVEALLREGVQPNAPMPAGVPAVIRDLLQWRWLVNATQAELEDAKNSPMVSETAIMQRLIKDEDVPLDGSANGLLASETCHTLKGLLILSDSDKTCLSQALTGTPAMTHSQRVLMRAGLLSQLHAWAIGRGVGMLGQHRLSEPVGQGLTALIVAQAGQLAEIGAKVESTWLGDKLADLDDVCIAHVGGLDSACLQDDAQLLTRTAGLGAQLAAHFGLYDVFTGVARQALVETLQVCRPALLALLAARYDGTLQAYDAQSWDDVGFSESIETINPENWLPLPPTLGEILAQNAAMVASLQSTFKARLSQRMNEVGRGTLRHDGLAGAGSVVQELYAHLTFRQLHMLVQFGEGQAEAGVVANQ